MIYCDVIHSIHTPRDSFRGALKELVKPFYNELPKVRSNNVHNDILLRASFITSSQSEDSRRYTLLQ